METSFKVKKSGKYIDIQYISNLKTQIRIFDNILVSSAKEGRVLISTIRKYEESFKKNQVYLDNGFDYRLIILKYLKAIDAIASGLDIRSRIPFEEMSERFIDSYKYLFDYTIKECNETYEYYLKVKNNSSYAKDWRRYDKFNENIIDFNLDYKKIDYNDFDDDELRNMDKLAKQALDLLILKNRNKND